ncbi:MAG: serine hydrolase, partial [Gemmatimonadetes bacterium]|nr:serine hydrolase [Gemmatimonadota bacterium]
EMPEEHRGGRLATGYSELDRDAERTAMPFFQGRGLAPAAGFASTVDDLARFASWQFRLEGDAEEVLHAHTLQEMQRVHYVDPEWDTFWGLGFSVRRHDDETLVGHGGSCPGYRTQLLLQPDDEIGIVFMANAGGVGTGTFVNGVYDLVAPPLKARAGKPEGAAAAAAEAASPAPSGSAASSAPPLADYLGTYDAQPWGGETAVVRWKGSVALLGLPTDNPARALTLLRHVEGDTFRRVLDGGDALGEVVAFERDAQGRVVEFVRFENRYPRIP